MMLSFRVHILMLLLSSFCLSGCSNDYTFVRDFTGVKPVNVDDGSSVFAARRSHIRGAPEGNDSYSMGWRAGCATNLSLVGAGTMRLLNERVDAQRLSTDPLYVRGHMDGTNYCQDRIDWEGH